MSDRLSYKEKPSKQIYSSMITFYSSESLKNEIPVKISILRYFKYSNDTEWTYTLSYKAEDFPEVEVFFNHFIEDGYLQGLKRYIKDSIRYNREYVYALVPTYVMNMPIEEAKDQIYYLSIDEAKQFLKLLTSTKKEDQKLLEHQKSKAMNEELLNLKLQLRQNDYELEQTKEKIHEQGSYINKGITFPNWVIQPFVYDVYSETKDTAYARINGFVINVRAYESDSTCQHFASTFISEYTESISMHNIPVDEFIDKLIRRIHLHQVIYIDYIQYLDEVKGVEVDKLILQLLAERYQYTVLWTIIIHSFSRKNYWANINTVDTYHASKKEASMGLQRIAFFPEEDRPDYTDEYDEIYGDRFVYAHCKAFLTEEVEDGGFLESQVSEINIPNKLRLLN